MAAVTVTVTVLGEDLASRRHAVGASCFECAKGWRGSIQATDPLDEPPILLVSPGRESRDALPRRVGRFEHEHASLKAIDQALVEETGT